MSQDEYIMGVYKKYDTIKRMSPIQTGHQLKILNKDWNILTNYSRENSEFLDRETWELTRKGY